ncbi:MAG: lipopolysaccharide biosynthesis protein [Erythrobacter sp.]|nr:lipopolysaccharide biosynthesis protein [Erythrobacter sp.]MDZ4274272.1 lipopolysaccharide biosynthesis protein [Erythrobacter sp.]
MNMAAKRSLSDRAVDGIAWQTVNIFGNIVLRAAILIALTRSLEARDFGIIAAVTVIVSITETVGLIGVHRVIVQKKVLGEGTIKSAFSISLLSGLLLTSVLYQSADLLESWLKLNGIAPFFEFLAVCLLVGSLASIPKSLLERDLRFKAISLVEITSHLVGFGLVALTLAYLGYGVWALAIGVLCQVVLRAIMLFSLRRPAMAVFPQRGFVDDLVLPGLGFSAGQLGNFTATQVDNLIIGRMLGADALGYYSRAYQFLMLPTQMFGTAVASVLFPTMATVQDQPKRVARAYMRAVDLIALLTLPVSGMLIIITPELVRFVLGAKWIGMIIPLQILLASLLFRTSYKISDAVTLAMGSMNARARRQWIYAGLVIAGATFGARWGLAGATAGVGLAIVANFFMMLRLVQRILKVPTAALLSIHLRQLRNALLICLPVWLAAEAGRYFGISDFLILLISASVGGLVTMVMWFQFRGLFGKNGDWLNNLIVERLSVVRKRISKPKVNK